MKQISTVGDELIESDHSIPTSSMTILINLEADDKTCFVLSNISLTSSMMCSVRTL